MKLAQRRGSKKSEAVSEDAASSEAQATSDGRKAKQKKKFSLFKKSKRKSKENRSPKRNQRIGKADTVTPATVAELEDENETQKYELIIGTSNRTTDKLLARKSENELHETLSWARNLLQELDTVAVDISPDGTELGTELVLPGTVYDEPVDDECDNPVEKDKIEAVPEEEEQCPQMSKTQSEEDHPDVSTDVSQPDVSTDVSQPDVSTDVSCPTYDNGEESKNDQDFQHDSTSTSEKQNSNEYEYENSYEENLEKVVEEKNDEVNTLQSLKEKSNETIKFLSNAFRGALESQDSCAPVHETLSRLMPTSWDAKAQQLNGGENNRVVVMDDKLGSEFFNDMLNTGFTLIYHKSVDDDDCWIGRTVDFKIRPGVCTNRKTTQPVIEWNTIVGGKTNTIETFNMDLLKVDAIANSNKNQSHSGGWWNSTLASALEGGIDDDEFDCFFTITSREGEIHLFEALNSEDANRIVAGIQHNTSRLTKLLIEGTSHTLLTSFYDNSNESEDSKIPENELLNRLSHAFLNGL